jgi:predicted lipoprotein with Yx(FWY)xxD motif
MRLTTRAVPVALAVTLMAAVVAQPSAAVRAHPSAAGKVVKTRHGSLGTYLVDGKGRTLYLFEKDSGGKSACYAACAQAWPPLLTNGKPRARGKAKASRLSTVRRADGSRQVVYRGHPLYYFIQDTKAGQTNGQGIDAFGALWYVVAPSGKRILGY